MMKNTIKALEAGKMIFVACRICDASGQIEDEGTAITCPGCKGERLAEAGSGTLQVIFTAAMEGYFGSEETRSEYLHDDLCSAVFSMIRTHDDESVACGLSEEAIAKLQKMV